MFEASYHNLSDEYPGWGTVAILPWDSEIFGFPVADFKAGDIAVLIERRSDVQRRLEEWAEANAVELIGCSVAAVEARWKTILPQLGFAYVDSTLVYTLPRLHRAKFPRSHPVRLAVADDREAIERIAAQVFNAGRYHADPRFPRELANARFRAWVARAFDSLSAENRVYVNSVPGSATGFLHATVNGDQAQLTIGAGDFSIQGTSTSTLVFFGFLEALRDSGVRRARSKLSSANMPILNLTAYAGARYSAPEYVFHWHAPGAVHLNDENLPGGVA
jgi:hypothetical protein